jgi:hypothetical protein
MLAALAAFAKLVAFVRAVVRVSNKDRDYWCTHAAVPASVEAPNGSTKLAQKYITLCKLLIKHS